MWEQALANVTELSGYTHLWREFPLLSAFCMASCDSEADRIEAKALGFRTFRVRGKDDSKLAGEGHCPASKEMGKSTQCAQCLLCGGARSTAKADITIIAHGTGALTTRAPRRSNMPKGQHKYFERGRVALLETSTTSMISTV